MTADKKKVSIKDIARLSGVSVATVSRVINNNGRFSEETRQKVLAVIAETGYEMNYSAKNLRMNKSFSIGIIVPDISNAFFAEVVQKIEEILFEEGYSTIICNTDRNMEKESAYLQMLEGKGVDGLVVISGAEKFVFDKRSRKKNIPYICIDREPVDRESTIFIASDHYQGGRLACRELLQHGASYPGLAIYDRVSTSSKERLRGFRDGLKEAGLGFDVTKQLLTITPDFQSFEEQLLNFLARTPAIDAIFAINDTIALEIHQICSKNAITIPERLKLIGFDDNKACRYVSPSLSSIQQNTQEIAKKAVQALLASLANQPSPKTITIPISLKSRESMG